MCFKVNRIHLSHFLFRYIPGDIVFIRAGELYHEVREWKATVKPFASQEVNPGRTSMVFFNNKHAHKVLKDKPANWLMTTGANRSYAVATPV